MSGVPGRVLVVDDNKVIRQLIRVNLELEGFEVVTAADGAECLDVVQQVQPDVVTLDVVMPRLDGLRTAARLRSDARTRNLPIIVVSACTQYEVESGLEVGVDAFLAKPFEPSELVQIVRQLMDRARRGEGPGEPRGGGRHEGGGGGGGLGPGLGHGQGYGLGQGSGLGPGHGHGNGLDPGNGHGLDAGHERGHGRGREHGHEPGHGRERGPDAERAADAERATQAGG